MYQLYYSPGACSMAIHVVLNELSQPVELKKLNLQAGEGQTPEFLKINPRGQVPVLVNNDLVIRENGAILTYLLDEHQSKLLPRNGKARAQALEWLMFGNATLHPAYARLFFLMKNVKDKPGQEHEFYKTTIEQINKLWKDVDDQLGKSRYLCGTDVTAGDILLTVIANWESYLPVAPTLGSNVKRLLREIIARPAYQKALKAEEVEYKAAA